MRREARDDADVGGRETHLILGAVFLLLLGRRGIGPEGLRRTRMRKGARSRSGGCAVALRIHSRS
jgi:hypothetical protein